MVVLQPIKPGAPRFTLALKRGRARRALSLLGTNDAQQNLQLAESLLTISSEDFAKKWNFDPVRETPLEGGRFQWTPVTAPEARHSASENEDLQACLSVPSLDLPRPGAAAEGVQEVVAECRLVVASLEAGRPTCLSSAAPAHARAQSGESCPQCPDSAAAAPAATRRVAPAQNARDGASAAATAVTEPAPSDAPAARVPSADAPTPTPQSEDNTPAQPTPAEVTVSAEATPTETTSSVLPTAAALSLRQTCITDFVRPRKRRAVSIESHYHVPHKKALLQLRA
ncbi:predicted GPI-anchored protein 58 [Penaeus chinensis]|uniref:predicted GPI-anchored protein 58 n=1 Tax=Penaeus chinensis TaxID=139456 RepID=UPI001FB7D6E6|nr:predicted GPI-anchored protein 58 [Penaeus chinensis]